ncbi:protein HID1b isoform X3 [Syngnathus scovelli]|uniref:protein HID1b isoform X3 n=1 Tax=Syngnathus scovelli TaxID=161590 RepID=UPI0021109FE9|nr:protein HID1 isoform X3 [Syngnathus scovelli]
MGNGDSKLHFRKAVIQLTSTTQAVEASDDVFWEQFWAEPSVSVQDIFALVPAAEIRALREESPSNLATLCYKAVGKLSRAAGTGCRSERERVSVLNCVRLLTRVLPFVLEDADWRGFMWAGLPARKQRCRDDGDDAEPDGARPLGESLLVAVGDLLFCPGFTVQARKRDGREVGADPVDSCELIWETGVGFSQSPPPPLNSSHDSNRTELLKLLLTCFSEVLYLEPARRSADRCLLFFCSAANRHTLPLFTSLLNVVCAYEPWGWGFPYEHLLLTDRRRLLVEQALHVLLVALERPAVHETHSSVPENQFVNFLSRIHREEDLGFILKGVSRLLNKPLMQTYLPNSSKKIIFHQELLILLWKLCHFNKKFLFFVLKSSDVLDVLVPILFFLNEARADPAGADLVHMGVLILLLLSGERNFGVRLNKPFTLRIPLDVPVFSGTHADLLLVIFHRMMTCGNQRLQPLFHCLLTVIVNEIATERCHVGHDGAAVLDAAALGDIECNSERAGEGSTRTESRAAGQLAPSPSSSWSATQDWVLSWKSKLPLQTIMRLLQVLVPQVEKICIDKALTDEREILKFLQHGTLVGLLPVPHPILIRKYQANAVTAWWLHTYTWGVVYLRNLDPPIWYDTDIRLFEIQRT